MNREQRRALKKQTNDETTQTLDLMLNIGSKCLTCEKLYDKLSKEMVRTWFVEVYKAAKRVDLYCPECYEKRKHELSK